MAAEYLEEVYLLEIDTTMLNIDLEQITKFYKRYGIPTIGHIPVDIPNELYRLMCCQLNSTLLEES